MILLGEAIAQSINCRITVICVLFRTVSDLKYYYCDHNAFYVHALCVPLSVIWLLTALLTYITLKQTAFLAYSLCQSKFYFLF